MNTSEKGPIALIDLHGPVLKRKWWAGKEHHIITRPASYTDLRSIQDLPTDVLADRLHWVNFRTDEQGKLIVERKPEVPPEVKDFDNIFCMIEDLLKWWDNLGTYDFNADAAVGLRKLAETTELAPDKLSWRFHTGMNVELADQLAQLLVDKGIDSGQGTMRGNERVSSSVTKFESVELAHRSGRRVVSIDDDPYHPDVLTRFYDMDVYLTLSEKEARRAQRATPDPEVMKMDRKGRILYGQTLDDFANDILGSICN